MIKDDGAWEIISQADVVYVGRGKKVQEFVPAEEQKEEILKLCLGRTGNLRAPALRNGGRLYVGFNENMYGDLGK